MRSARSVKASQEGLTPARLQQAALRYLTGRDRTEAQLRAYLLRRGASPDALVPLVQRLLEFGYLDDEGYAMRWAESRLRQKPMGRARLELELRQQGLNRSLVRQALDRLFGSVDEVDLARQLLERRRSRPPEARPAWRRQVDLLRRHGFGSDIIRAVLGSMRPEEDPRADEHF